MVLQLCLYGVQQSGGQQGYDQHQQAEWQVTAPPHQGVAPCCGGGGVWS